MKKTVLENTFSMDVFLFLDRDDTILSGLLELEGGKRKRPTLRLLNRLACQLIVSQPDLSPVI